MVDFGKCDKMIKRSRKVDAEYSISVGLTTFPLIFIIYKYTQKMSTC